MEKLVPKLRFPEFEGNWEKKRLEEVSTFLDGKRKPIKSQERQKMKGIYPYYGASGIIDYVNDYIFDEELILLGEDGENIVSRNLPLAFRVSGKCWVNNHAHVIIPNKDTNIDFLTHNLERLDYAVYNTGSAQPKLNQEVCKKIITKFPSLPEQQKIATFLTSVDERLTLLAQQKEKLELYKKGVMQQIFSQKLRFKDENGNTYPDWEEKKLGEIGFFQTSSIDKLTKEDEKKVFLVNYMNVYRHEDINNETVKSFQVVSAKDAQIESCNLKKGDILFTPSSETPDDIGRSVVIFEDLENSVFSYHLMRFRPTIEINILFSHYFCNVPSVLKQLSKYATGSTRFTISVGNFSKVKVQIPCLEEQQKIASFLSAIDFQIEGVSKKIEQTKLFKKGLLQQMFV